MGKPKTTLLPLAVKNNGLSDGIIYSAYGEDFIVPAKTTNYLLRGKDGYLRSIDAGEAPIEWSKGGKSPYLLTLPTYYNEIRNSTTAVSGGWFNQHNNTYESPFLSPEGKNNAIYFTNNVVNSGIKGYYHTTDNLLTPSEHYSYSFFAKRNENLDGRIGLRIRLTFNNTETYLALDLNELTATTVVGAGDLVQGVEFEEFGNDWIRIGIYGINTQGSNSAIQVFHAFINQLTDNFFGTSNSYIEQGKQCLYGFQMVFANGGSLARTVVNYKSKGLSLPYSPNPTATQLQNVRKSVYMDGVTDLKTCADNFILYYDGQLLGENEHTSTGRLLFQGNGFDITNHIALYFATGGSGLTVQIRSNSNIILSSGVSLTGVNTANRVKVVWVLNRNNDFIRVYINGNIVYNAPIGVSITGNFEDIDLMDIQNFGLSNNITSVTGTDVLFSKIYALGIFDYSDELLNKLITF